MVVLRIVVVLATRPRLDTTVTTTTSTTAVHTPRVLVGAIPTMVLVLTVV